MSCYSEPDKVISGSDNLKNSYLLDDMVSVIIPCHNSSRFISQTIESVLAQTYQNWEMVIAYDHSTDNSFKIIKEYKKKDRRIKLIELEKNNGLAVARNRAIEEAKGRYIAFLDSDDIWLPQKLEKQIRFMDENNVALNYSSYYFMDENGAEKGVFLTKEIATYKELLKTCFIGNLTAMYDASRIGKQYMENVGHQDYTLWLKILKKVGIAKGIMEPLAKYRLHNKSISTNKITAGRWQWNIYRNIEKLSLIMSIYYFIHYTYYGSIKYRRNKKLKITIQPYLLNH